MNAEMMAVVELVAIAQVEKNALITSVFHMCGKIAQQVLSGRIIRIILKGIGNGLQSIVITFG